MRCDPSFVKLASPASVQTVGRGRAPTVGDATACRKELCGWGSHTGKGIRVGRSLPAGRRGSAAAGERHLRDGAWLWPSSTCGTGWVQGDSRRGSDRLACRRTVQSPSLLMPVRCPSGWVRATEGERMGRMWCGRLWTGCCLTQVPPSLMDCSSQPRAVPCQARGRCSCPPDARAW